MVAAVRPYVDGVQVSAPYGRFDIAAEVLASLHDKAKKPTE
jgi:hypothetical protein